MYGVGVGYGHRRSLSLWERVGVREPWGSKSRENINCWEAAFSTVILVAAPIDFFTDRAVPAIMHGRSLALSGPAMQRQGVVF
ncbi:hypothetical protein BIY27_24485 [Gibbsiella quercinecans]|nr:hypothetical protein BIY27_24485 [Gibbsiella quercinecans]